MTFTAPAARPARWLLLAVAALQLAACSATRQLSADETFTAANENFEDGAYDAAIEGYKDLLDRHPFSEHATEAETRIARAYYLLGRHAEAIAAFSDFERMHPTSPDVPLVTYYLGMSYLKQMRPSDRDQSASQNAHAYFRAVIDRYPGTEWAQRSELRLRECEEVLAQHELYVIRYYLRHRMLAAAESRYRGLLEAYPHTEAAARALLRFGREYEKRERYRPASLSLRVLIETHPDNPLVGEATTLLTRIDPKAPSARSGEDPLRELLRELAIGTVALEPTDALPDAPRWVDPVGPADEMSPASGGRGTY